MKIYKLGEEVLRKKCVPVKPEEINDTLRGVLNEMFDTMIQADGVGLAGPQVGIGKRLFVVIADDDVRRVFINPQITATSEEQSDYEEGCLSIPGMYESIRRPARVTIQALNEFGKPFTIDADGFLARVVQHENDHLDGVMFIDRGDKAFADKAVETFKRRAERAEKKAAKAAARARSIADKLAAKAAKTAAKKSIQEGND